ncbi:dethiobiotin synthase [Dyadobacter sp. LHD-138]|uniref:dethiobiotin synthase n=1 Tax=Dyadobacter sp. LHD-138 TaxID=3071413 RepID=UPI0027DF6F4A|nr:dethiobiotin synthase [Dyadobacter sp. LHD-138]MDQ6479452.1 dethiobiotin synthase [Dyadobacter sp. LHD-138]
MKASNKLFVTGIGTGVGKTICAAILVEYLQADYWKPIQSGDLEQSDSMQIQQLVNEHIRIHPERYRLKLAASPHKSAAQEQLTIQLADFKLPETDNHLIVEGAGGLFVPISDTVYVRDLIQRLALPVVLVARDYLGCINHTLLTLKVLKEDRIPIAYFVFNGLFDPDTKRAITKFLDRNTCILQLPDIATLDRATVQQIAKQITSLTA